MFILTWIAPLKTKYSLLHVNITVSKLYFSFQFPDKRDVFTNSFPPKLRSHPPRGGWSTPCPPGRNAFVTRHSRSCRGRRAASWEGLWPTCCKKRWKIPSSRSCGRRWKAVWERYWSTGIRIRWRRPGMSRRTVAQEGYWSTWRSRSKRPHTRRRAAAWY